MHVDGVTGATPLNLMKFANESTPVGDLLRGSIGGSLGETSALLILAGGAYLAWKRYLDWRIPVSVLLVVGALSSVLHYFDGRTTEEILQRLARERGLELEDRLLRTLLDWRLLNPA